MSIEGKCPECGCVTVDYTCANCQYDEIERLKNPPLSKDALDALTELADRAEAIDASKLSLTEYARPLGGVTAARAGTPDSGAPRSHGSTPCPGPLKSEFGEPWMLSEYGRFLGGAQWSLCGTTEPYAIQIIAECKHEEIAKRIIACVNFCRGVSTEELLSECDRKTNPRTSSGNYEPEVRGDS